MKILFSIFFLTLLSCSTKHVKSQHSQSSLENVKEVNKPVIKEVLFEVVKIDYYQDVIQRIFVIIPIEKVDNDGFIEFVICSLKKEYKLGANSNLSFFSEKKYADYKDNLFEGIDTPEGLTGNKKVEYEDWMNSQYLAEYSNETKTYATYPVSAEGKKKKKYLIKECV